MNARAATVFALALFLAAGGCTRVSLLDTSAARPAPPRTLELTIREGATYARGSVHPIRWTLPEGGKRLEVTVALFESTDGGASWRSIGYAPTNERFTRWKVPDADRARLGIQFTILDDDDAPLRRAETPDIPLVASQEKAYVWTKMVDEAAFGPRDGAGGIVYRDRMWLIGGWNPARFPLQSANDVWSSADGATWILEKPNTFFDRATFDRRSDWEGRHFAGYQAFGGKMWIVGGDANLGFYQTDVWSSEDGKSWSRTDVHTVTPRADPATGEPYPPEVWPAVEESQFGMRTAHVTGTLGDRMFVIGGQRVSTMVNPVWPGKPAAALDDVWATRDGATFALVPPVGARFAGRGFVSEAPTLNGKLWLVGGGLYDDPPAGIVDRIFFNDVWSSRDGAAWEKTLDEPPFSPRTWHDVKAFDDRIWVVNGYDGPSPTEGRMGDNLRDVWYSRDGANWYEASPPKEFVPRHAGTAWVHRGSLFVGSGNEIDTKWRADVWRLSPR